MNDPGEEITPGEPSTSPRESGKLSMLGFAKIAKSLHTVHPNPSVCVTLSGVKDTSLWPQLNSNPSFSYYDFPIHGWRKDVCVRMSGKTQGSLEIAYAPPERQKRLKSKPEAMAYLSRTNDPHYQAILERLDYRTVFCVCHQSERGGPYIECSYGKAGCQGWVHPQCVGLGKKSEEELSQLGNIICPLCTLYLQGSMEEINSPDHLKLNQITCQASNSGTFIRDLLIEESCQEHTRWGMDKSGLLFCSGGDGDAESTLPAATLTLPRGMSMGSIRRHITHTAATATHDERAKSGLHFEHALFSLPPSSGDDIQSSSSPSPSITMPSSKPLASLLADLPMMHWDRDRASAASITSEESMDRVIAPPVADQTRSALLPSQRFARGDDGRQILVTIEVTPPLPVSKSKGEPEPAASRPRGAAEKVFRHDESIPLEAEAVRDYRSLDVQWGKVIVDFGISRAHSSGSKRKGVSAASASSSSSDASAAAALSVSRGGADWVEPVLCLLPLVDGGLRLACVSSGSLPRSLHSACSAKQLCGSCLHPLELSHGADRGTEDKGLDGADRKAIAAGPKNKKAKAEVKPKVGEAVDLDVGSVKYSLHENCAIMLASADPFSISLLSGGVLLHSGDETEAWTIPGVISLGAIYEYDEAEDANCDICGRYGGVLIFYALSSSISSLPPPSEEGWLGHVPCLHWLLHCGILKTSSVSGPGQCHPHRDAQSTEDADLSCVSKQSQDCIEAKSDSEQADTSVSDVNPGSGAVHLSALDDIYDKLSILQSCLEGRESVGLEPFQPVLSVVEARDKFNMNVNLPKIETADLKVSICDGFLQVDALRPPPGRGSHPSPKEFGTFHSYTPIPTRADCESALAKIENGILRVEFSKK